MRNLRIRNRRAFRLAMVWKSTGDCIWNEAIELICCRFWRDMKQRDNQWSKWKTECVRLSTICSRETLFQDCNTVLQRSPIHTYKKMFQTIKKSFFLQHCTSECNKIMQIMVHHAQNAVVRYFAILVKSV